jgi:hypothetical protein
VTRQRYEDLVKDVCKAFEIGDAQAVLQRGALEVSGHEIAMLHLSNDEHAMYMNFNFGICSAGKTLRLFHLMLQSNLTIYSQDQAQLGVSPDTGVVLLIVRVPMTDDIDGAWLAETFTHYSEHGRYWRQNISDVADDQYLGPPSAHFVWMRA